MRLSLRRSEQRAAWLFFICGLLPCAGAWCATEPLPAVQFTALPEAPLIAPVMQCRDLAGRDFAALTDAPTRIVSADLVPATAERPEFCLITGYVAPQVQFQLRLPTRTYTGRYLQGGCGGSCGVIGDEFVPACDTGRAFSGAFAVAFENSGHLGASPLDTLWAYGNAPGRVDYAYRAAHVTALAAKALITAFYGRPPVASYFQGCSNGGREALMEAQRYPEDFDGIVAGAPAVWITPRVGRILWETQIAMDADDRPILTPASVQLLHAAVIQACDALDGARDGQIDDPRDCHYDPGALVCHAGHAPPECLTAQQAGVMRQMYRGPADDRGRPLYLGGEPYGSELTWIGPGSLTTIGSSLVANQIKNMIFDGNPPQDFHWRTWKVDEARLRTLFELGGYYDASNPHLEKFRDAGHKLILWQGTADSSAGPHVLLDYYQRVRDVVGGLRQAREFSRVFLVPGVYHCHGGYVPYQEDLLGPLVSWVERGEAPERIDAAAVLADGTTRTRPLFAYPARARYKGTGSIDDAANFTRAMPAVEPDDHFFWLGAQFASELESH